VVEEKKEGVSVILCTYNGAERLPQTFAHLASQTVSKKINWEIIIVDNNSTDNTFSEAQEIWKTLNCKVPFYVLHQPTPGKSNALQQGIQFASYNILIICDDDNWLNNNYVSVAYEIMTENKKIGIAGGSSIGYFETKKPEWFDKYEYAFVVGKQMVSSGIANGRKYLVGAGMVIRKEIYDTLEALNHTMFLTCRKGSAVSSGGDSETCMLAIYLGYDLYYDERLIFTHFITSKRLNWSYCVKLISQGFAEPQIYFAMYDYCYQSSIKGEVADFENIIRWNRRKLLRGIINDCRGGKNFFICIRLLLRSVPGSRKEIEIKTKINKLFNLIRNKKKLNDDFNIINAFIQRLIKTEKNSAG
jgi:glycosyltransferase involved in cell wall biosynthesis